ncbi:MAG: hypothetical protein HOQ07_11250 [Sinomonas sp.]|nr:hypothetical protein [Sinomonas sp.]
MVKRTDDFAQIVRGDVVTVDGPDDFKLTGVVEDVSPDGSVMWVREDGVHTRRMIHVTDGAEVRRQHAGEASASRSLEPFGLPG